VLGASLEGFQARGRYADNQVYTGIVARTHQADEAAVIAEERIRRKG
jgi:hypothetical protein